MTTTRRFAGLGFALVLGGCCLPGGTPPAPPAPPTTAGPPGALPVVPPVVAPAPALGAACLAGRWRASEVMALVERDMREGLRGGDIRLVSSTGALVVELGATDATGTGTMTVRAEDLVHRLRGRTQGMDIDITHTLTGTATMPYALTLPVGLRVERPTQSTIRGRANANAGGFRMSQNTGPRFDLHGDYVFVCTPTTLTVNEAGGRALTFTRE